MEGVTVSARATGSSITTSVFTDADGQYFFPPLSEGRHKVWAQAVRRMKDDGDTPATV